MVLEGDGRLWFRELSVNSYLSDNSLQDDIVDQWCTRSVAGT